MKSLILLVLTVSVVCCLGGTGEAVTADHTSVSKLSSVPPSVIQQVRNRFDIFYGHTSHGSQIVTGMSMVRSQDTLYRYNEGSGSVRLTEYGTDLGQYGDTAWVTVTRQHLNQPGNTTNLVMWSWCGGVSGNTEEGINIYLNAMNQLEQEYPGVLFMYMTGHLDGSGVDGNLYVRNNQIRAYCALHNKLLFDFADIESYDPSNAYYPDAADDCAWCSTWCATHDCLDCGDCAHSHCFNCHRKGQAFWWLLARATGWQEGPCCAGDRGNIDCDPANGVDISDLSALIDNLYITFSPLCCKDEANCDGSSDGNVDISDLSALIDFLYINFTPLPACP
jgi:hypothetical protein